MVWCSNHVWLRQNSVSEVVNESKIEFNVAALGGGVFTADAAAAYIEDSEVADNIAQVCVRTYERVCWLA